MAVTKEQLLISVEVNSTKFDDFSKSAKNNFKQISDDSDKAGDHISEFAKYFASVAVSIDSASRSLQQIASQFSAVSDSVQKTANASKNINDLNVNIEQTSVLTRILIGGFKSLALSVAGVAVYNLAKQFSFFKLSIVPIVSDFQNLINLFKKTDHELSRKISPAFFRYGEVLWDLSTPLAIIGALLTQTDSAFLSFAGSVSLASSSAGLFYGMIISQGLGAIADLSIAIGSGLLSAMSDFESKFQKAQVVMSQFTFTIQGFQRALGEGVVGSMEKWVGLLNEMRDTTTFSTTEIAKSIKLLVAEGTRFGLNQAQITELVKRTGDVAASFGENIDDVAGKVNAAFAGNAQSLMQMGFAVSDSSASHSELYLSMGKTMDQMSKSEKAAVRYDLIMQETAALAGAASNQTLTVAGANAILERSYNDLQVKLGSSGGLYTALIGLQAKFVQSISTLPDYILDTVGALQEWGGVSFVVVGTLLKNFVMITTLAMAYKFLSVAMATNATLQATLTAVTATLGDVLGVQTIAVTSLGAAWKNVVLIIKSMLAQTFATLMLSLKALAAGMWNVIVMSSLWLKSMAPILIKVAAVAAIVSALIVGLKEFVEEVSFVREGLQEIAKSFDIFGDSAKKQVSVFDEISQAIQRFFRWLVNLTKLLIGGVATTVLVASRLFVDLSRAIRFVSNGFSESDEDTEAYNLQLNEMNKRLKETADFTLAAGSKVDIFSSSTAYAKESSESFSKALAKNNEALDRLVNINLKSFDKSSERIKALGDEFDVAAQSLADANKKLDEAKASTLDLDEKAKTIADATIVSYKEQLNVEKLRQDTIKKVADQKKQIDIDALRSSGRIIEATKLENEERIRAFEEQVRGLEKIGQLNKEQEQSILSARKSIEKVNASKLNEAIIETSRKSIEALSELKKKVSEYQAQSQLAGQSEYAQIKIKLKIELDEIDALAQKLEAQKMLTAEARQYVEVAKKAALSKANSEQADQLKKDAKDLEVQRTALQRSNSNIGKTPYQIATEDQKRQLEELEKQRAKFQEEGKLPKTGPMTPDQQKLSNELDASKAEIEKQQLLGNSESFNKAKDVGDQIAVKMTTALQGPVMGSIMGAMQGAMGVISVAQGVIDIAQQLVDAIPKLLNSFANLVNSIVDLPLKLAEAIGNVINSVMNIIKNAIPNVIKAVINVVDAIRNFVREAPKQFVMMIDKSVEMITKFIDDLPTIAQEMAQNLTEAIPKTMAKSIEFAMLSAPKIMVRLIKLIYTELPPAIWHGIMEGFKEFGRVFQRWMKGDFSGQKMKLDVDTSAVKKQLSNLTKDSSRLFSVTAIADAAKNATNEAKKIDDAAKRAGKNMWQAFIDAMVKAWHNFLDAGGSIWQGILDAIGVIAETFGAWGTAIWNGLVNAIGDIAETLGAWGTAIWNGVVKAVGEIAKTFGEWGGAIWNGLVDMVKDPAKFFGDWGEKIWNGFLGPIGDAFGGFGTALWTGVTTAIGELPKTFGNWGKVMWSGFTDLIKDPAKFFGGWGTKIWNGFFTPIGDAFSGFGTAIFDGLKEALKGVGSLFSDLGGQIFNGLKAGLDSIGNVLSKMFQFDGGGTGTVENFIGMDFPFVSFAKGGLVPGQAPIPGDSLLNDRIPALLSPGEVVLPRSVLGDEAFRRVVMAKLAGQDVPQLAGGGFIGGVLGNLIPQWIRDLYDSISKYIGGIDLVQLAKDPKGTIENALRNNLSAFKDNFKKMVKGYVEGGLVTGPGGTDVVPGMLTAGEFVLNRQTVGRVGLGNLVDLNTGKSQLGNQTSNVTVNLTVNTSEKLDESFIRQRLMPAIRDELKRNSLDGRTIVYAGGVRK